MSCQMLLGSHAQYVQPCPDMQEAFSFAQAMRRYMYAVQQLLGSDNHVCVTIESVRPSYRDFRQRH